MHQPPVEIKGNGIDNLKIDPVAEPINQSPSPVSAQQENEFFKQSGLHFQLQHNEQNLGLLGKLFGSNSSAAGNIAGFVAVVSLLAFLVTLFFSSPDIVEARKLLMGLISTALAFLFGAATKK